MDIIRKAIVHEGPGGVFEAMAIRDRASRGPQPGVMLVPNVLGTKEQDFAKGERLAALGYVVLVADVYGQGKRTTRTDPDMRRYMEELLADRRLLLRRLAASLDVLRRLEGCDTGRIAAIGFCFGGLCVLDMARGGLDVRGVISFHGIFDRPDYDNVKPIRARILASHGWNDPLCPPDAVSALAAELTASGADWRLHAHGHAGHAFTDPEVHMPEQGFAYDDKADQRSWVDMVHFLEETLR